MLIDLLNADRVLFTAAALDVERRRRMRGRCGRGNHSFPGTRARRKSRDLGLLDRRPRGRLNPRGGLEPVQSGLEIPSQGLDLLQDFFGSVF